MFAVLALSGCVATDVGNPQTEPEVEAEVTLEAFEEELPNALNLDDGIELTHIWVATDRIDLTACESADSEAELEDESEDAPSEFVEPTVTDLLTGTSFPASPILALRGSNHCGFELRARPLLASELPAGAPADVAGASFVVRGLRKDGAPFLLRTTEAHEFELEGDIRLSADTRRRLSVGFAVNGWVRQADIGPLQGDPIRIDDETNTELLERFEDLVGESMRVFDGALGGVLLAD